MGDQVLSGMLAVTLGVGLAVLLFVPFVAISYRRRGRLSFARSVLWLGALIYFLAIWTYTLLPLPDPDTIRCVGMVLDPTEVVRELQKAFASPGNPLRHPAFLQLAFNVLLFVPLGVFLRVLGGRGIVTALLVGLGLSLFIETTQLTGVWGLYPCAYRFFDVGDLMTNTTGALLGSVFALVVPRAKRGMRALPDADEPRPVTRGRRAIAMLCDVLAFWFAEALVTVVAALWIQYGVGDSGQTGRDVASFIGTVIAAGFWLVLILATGRSVGDLAVQLRYAGARMPEVLARLLRWLGGIAGLSAIPLAGGPFGAVSALLFVIACVMLFTTRFGRGLPGILSGQQLTDAREGAARARR